ncbi:disease resistance protein UNI-like [Silene latifolia]|uniref:disease resistance protein UNI-like n=1 Tax=Silene latifolia TaxID=37657 RepID=UPI003D778A57
MRPNAVFWILLLTILRGGESRDEDLLSNKTELLNASYVEMFGKCKKRKRVSEFGTWSARALRDEEGFPQSKRQARVEDCDMGVWVKKVSVQRCSGATVAHKCKDCLCSVCGSRRGLVVQGPSRGKHIPVNKLIGQKSSETQLQLLLLDSNVERVAIHGVKGIGKTTLMKHLHNYALNFGEMFDYVFWVTCPHPCSIKDLQDYIAMAVKCDLSSIHDTTARAKKLFETLVSHGRTVIFLDAVSEANLSLEHIGIPRSSEGSYCKLVITTSCALACRLLNSFETVQVNPLSEEEALALFMIEAGIDSGRISQLNDVPKLLSKKCCGVPRVIVETATGMCGIDDIREWRHRVNLGISNDVLFEVLTDQLE